ncbi:MAG: hypothetical protein ACOCP4_07180, partial [Candidatus Woesearchaeota archaeon]
PMTTSKDDAPRTAMNLSQTNHLMGVEDADPLLVSTGADEALAHMSNEFVRKAEKDGKISSISGNYITVEYSDGTTDSFPINTVEKNSSKSMYIPNEMTIMPKMKVGKKIKAGDILAYNKRFFKTDGISLHFTPGPIVTLALHSAPETYEDSTMVSKSLTKRLATKVIKKYSILLKSEAKIHESIADFKEVRSGEPLMVFETMTGDKEVDEFLNVESSELNRHEKKVKRGGRIVDMKVYRTSNLEDYSSSIQYHIKKIDDFLLNNKQSNAKQLEERGSTQNKIMFGKKNAKVKVGDKINGVKLNKDEVLFEYYIESYDVFSTGDKGTNYTSLKAINARVYDDDEMPVGVETGRNIEVVLSPNSPMKRMTNSVFITGFITAAIRKLIKQCKEDIGIE